MFNLAYIVFCECIWITALREKCRYLEFSGQYFPAFPHSDRIRSECGKIRTRKTPKTDTFHVVLALHYS